MNNIVNEPPQNENITFNNQLINDVINFCNNKEKDKLTSQDLEWQEQRRKRKVRKLDFEIK